MLRVWHRRLKSRLPSPLHARLRVPDDHHGWYSSHHLRRLYIGLIRSTSTPLRSTKRSTFAKRSGILPDPKSAPRSFGMTNPVPRALAPVRASSPTMSTNRRTPPPLPPKPGSTSRQYSSQSAQPQPPLRVNTSNVGGSFRRPEIRSGTSSFSATFTASASSWASKAKSGLNNYAKPMAKAAISHASNYVEAATDYINESRNGESSSRSMSGDLGSDGARQRARTSPRPVDKLSLLPQWAVRRLRKDREGRLLKDKDGQLLPPCSVCHMLNGLTTGRLQFDIEVRVSGYCATMTSAENAGYVMRAALKIMRGKLEPMCIANA